MSHRYRRPSKFKTFLLLISVPVCLVLAMNLFWLQYSTTRIVVGNRGVALVKLEMNGEVIDLGNLRTGETRFMFLPKGDMSLYTLTYAKDDYRPTACEVEVGNTKHHVETTLYGDRDSICTVSEPLLSEVMAFKFF